MARLLGKTTAEIKLAELNLAPQRYILPHSTFPSQDPPSIIAPSHSHLQPLMSGAHGNATSTMWTAKTLSDVMEQGYPPGMLTLD